MILNKRDKEILKLLNKNARETNSAIAKKLKLSKQAVGYRIKKMYNSGLIRCFYTEFNTSKLGYDSYYLFLELERITNNIEEQLIHESVNNKNIGWIISGIGKYNLILLVYARSSKEFESLYNEIKNSCSKFLSNSSFSVLTQSKKLGYGFLNSETIATQTEKAKSMELDEKDIKLMNALDQDSRQKLVTLAAKTSLSLDIVNHRLKKLKKEIINGFNIKLDISMLGINWYLLLIKLQPITKELKSKFVHHLASRKETYYLTSTIGEYDLIIDLHVKSSTEVKHLIFEIRDKFPEVIKSFDTQLIDKEHKISYLPNISRTNT